MEKFILIQGEEHMTKHEIDDMMRNLPSQRGWYATREESTLDKVLGGFAFVAFVVIICLL